MARRRRRGNPRGPVKLGILLAVAGAFGCEEKAVNVPASEGGALREERRCVGPDQNFADDRLCEQPDAGGATGTWVADPGRPDGGYWHHPHYHYVYVPWGFYPGIGASALGFLHATTPGSGAAAVRAGAATHPSASPGSHGTVSRGGFGGTGAAHSSSSAGA